MNNRAPDVFLNKMTQHFSHRKEFMSEWYSGILNHTHLFFVGWSRNFQLTCLLNYPLRLVLL
jgi:hypothetical protein